MIKECTIMVRGAGGGSQSTCMAGLSIAPSASLVCASDRVRYVITLSLALDSLHTNTKTAHDSPLTHSLAVAYYHSLRYHSSKPTRHRFASEDSMANPLRERCINIHPHRRPSLQMQSNSRLRIRLHGLEEIIRSHSTRIQV